MRIDLQTKATELSQSNRASEAKDANASKVRESVAQAPGDDQATLSLASGRMQAMRETVIAQPEVRSQKVEALRQAVRDGRYQVEPQQVAESMFAEMMARARQNVR